MRITFFAGAADAAGTTVTELETDGMTASELTALLGRDNERLASVLPRCTLLVDGAPVRDPGDPIGADARVDVLPPFAGG
jgi:molybdopterin converting factor small subunit